MSNSNRIEVRVTGPAVFGTNVPCGSGVESHSGQRYFIDSDARPDMEGDVRLYRNADDSHSTTWIRYDSLATVLPYDGPSRASLEAAARALEVDFDFERLFKVAAAIEEVSV